MIKVITFFFFINVSYQLYAQQDSIIQRIFLIGDAGVLQNNSHPVIDWLTKNVNWNDEKNVAVFLGDNIYPDGLPDEGDAEYAYTKKVIDYQIAPFKGKKSKAYFVPGNHDWKGGKIGGWERAVNQVNYINSMQLSNIQSFPINGCPGPIPVELNEKVVLVIMDSQWFLHIHDKPGPESSCEARSMDEFTTELRQIVETHPNQLLVLAMHHPMYTYGVHGGAFTWKHHIFPFADAIKGLYIPLPLLGSVYPLARGLFGSLQDTYHPLYRTMINEIEQVLKEHPNVVTAAGHEHSLQLIIKDSITHIVSGSAAKLTRLRSGENSLFSILDYGFSVLEISKSGKTHVKFYNLQSANLSAPLFAKELTQVTQIIPKSTMDTTLPQFGNIYVQASNDMQVKGIKQYLWGENYRYEWTEKISIPILDIGKEAGGLTPIRQQGSRQSKMLRLADINGKEWVLRSVEKFPEVIVPADLRSALSAETWSNGVSGVYPYASLSVPELERVVGIQTLQRKLVYVPDDPRLERFRTGFKNSIALLEKRDPEGPKKTITTEDMILLLAKDSNALVIQKSVLWARLMDNFVMDFNRHEGKWKWFSTDTGRIKKFIPIGHDHDHAFFKSDGLLTTIMHHPWFMPETQGFRSRAHNIKTFNKAARNFDRFFLNSLSENDWVYAIDSFLLRVTNETIHAAMRLQPAEVIKYSGEKIAQTLISRKSYFKNEMLKYYRFISAKVDIVGTNRNEFVLIEKTDNGNVLVTIKKKDLANTSDSFYKRMFDSRVTNEISIYVLEGDDSMVVKGGDTRIKIRLIGGPGNDDFVNESTGKNVNIYDATFEQNTIVGSGFDNKNISDPEVNRYNFMGFKYNVFRPYIELEYNIDDGLVIGLGSDFVKHGFRKEPYGMKQSISAEKAIGTGSYKFRYEADFVKAIKDYDLNIRAEYLGPVHVTNFFGLGNNTEIDKTRNVEFYKARYQFGSIAMFIGKQLQSWMRVGIGPAYQYISFHRSYNAGKFVSDVNNNGLNPFTFQKTKQYLGVKGEMLINSRNSPVLPTRGALIQSYFTPLFGINSYSKNNIQTGLDIRIFMSFLQQTKFVFATRVGVGKNFGKYEFQQAQYLSGLENLRGYRRERFAGRSMVFNNSEIRLKIASFPFYIFSGNLGVVGFHDIGRVWSDNEKSSRWHNGYGAGIWVSLYRRMVVVGSVAFSKDETALPLITFGFQF